MKKIFIVAFISFLTIAGLILSTDIGKTQDTYSWLQQLKMRLLKTELADSLSTDYGIQELGTAWIDSAKITDGSIASGDISIIAGAKIQINAIDSLKIADASISGSDLVNPFRTSSTFVWGGSHTFNAGFTANDNTKLSDLVRLQLGTSADGILMWDTAETNDAVKLGQINGSSNNFIFTTVRHITDDTALAISPHPTIAMRDSSGAQGFQFYANSSDQAVFTGASGGYTFDAPVGVVGAINAKTMFGVRGIVGAQDTLFSLRSSNGNTVAYDDSLGNSYRALNLTLGGILTTSRVRNTSSLEFETDSNNIMYFGDKNTGNIYFTHENNQAGQDSSITFLWTSGSPNININGTDGDTYKIGINTSDQAVFSGASGGYLYDAPVGVVGTPNAKTIFAVKGIVGAQDTLQSWQSSNGNTVAYFDSLGNQVIEKISSTDKHTSVYVGGSTDDEFIVYTNNNFTTPSLYLYANTFGMNTAAPIASSLTLKDYKFISTSEQTPAGTDSCAVLGVTSGVGHLKLYDTAIGNQFYAGYVKHKLYSSLRDTTGFTGGESWYSAAGDTEYVYLTDHTIRYTARTSF